jgi:hypothetical protein
LPDVSASRSLLGFDTDDTLTAEASGHVILAGDGERAEQIRPSSSSPTGMPALVRRESEPGDEDEIDGSDQLISPSREEAFRLRGDALNKLVQV